MNGNRMIKKSRNFFGVECAEPKVYSQTGRLLDGFVEIEIECLTKLHIGNGSYKKYGNSVSKALMTYNGEPVIPGSSLKGCVRVVASAVSHSCIRDIDIWNKNNAGKFPHDNFKCTPERKCIICSMFGTMGYASRVNFSEMLPSAKCIIDTVQKKEPTTPQYPINNSRKFYKRDINGTITPNVGSGKVSDISPINVEAVREGSKFGGKIFFRGLTEEQLSLLMFALGFDESFNLLVGGFRFDGLGMIKIMPVNYRYDLTKTPKELAEGYASATDCSAQIAQFRSQQLR